jgi:hypothetical protein
MVVAAAARETRYSNVTMGDRCGSSPLTIIDVPSFRILHEEMPIAARVSAGLVRTRGRASPYDAGRQHRNPLKQWSRHRSRALFLLGSRPDARASGETLTAVTGPVPPLEDVVSASSRGGSAFGPP